MLNMSSVVVLVLQLTLVAIFPLAITTSISGSLNPSPSPSTQGISVELIHISDTRSPFHKTTPILQKPTSYSRKSRTQDAEFLLNSDFIIEFYLGFPAQRLYGTPSMGDSLMRIQCCTQCSDHNETIYNLSESDNKPFSCIDDKYCNLQGVEYYCSQDSDHNCIFYIIHFYEGYGHIDGRGEILPVKMWVAPIGDGELMDLGNVIFGCMYNFTSTPLGGIIGLDTSNASFVGQLSYTCFSYCLDPSQIPNLLRFGTFSNLVGNIHIPLVPTSFFYTYHIHPVGIMVGSAQLDIKNYFQVNTSTFEETGEETGMIIDIGTSFSILPVDIIFQIVQQIQMINVTIDVFLMGNHTVYCTEAEFFVFQPIPDIVFQFEGGTTFIIPYNNVWFHNTDGVTEYECLAFLDNPGSLLYVMGTYQLMGLNVGIDLERMEIVIGDSCPI